LNLLAPVRKCVAEIIEGLPMHLVTKTAFAALLLGSTVVASAMAAQSYTGCPTGYHRAESEGSGAGSVNYAGAGPARRAESEGSGVGSVNYAGAGPAHKAESEGSGVGSVNYAGAGPAHKAESEGSGVGSVNYGGAGVRQAEAVADMPCVPNK
jgi:hypothetical protein